MKGVFRRFEGFLLLPTMLYHASIYAHSLLDLAPILGPISFLCSELCIDVLRGRRRSGEGEGSDSRTLQTSLCRGLYSYMIHLRGLYPWSVMFSAVRDRDCCFHLDENV